MEDKPIGDWLYLLWQMDPQAWTWLILLIINIILMVIIFRSMWKKN